MSEEKKATFQNAQTKLEEIYNQYEIEITNTEKNDFEFNYFCFSCVVDHYPKLDFHNTGHSEEHDQSLEDNYGELIEKLWVQLEVEKEKCACEVCKNNLHFAKNCYKVVRQSLKQRSYRTCPFCQKDIPKEKYERHTKTVHKK